MQTIRDYPSNLEDGASRRLETFSYLPAMNAERIRRQIEYIVARGWNPAIEHAEPESAGETYWYLWKLPLFGETDVDAIIAECEACRRAHPRHHVKLLGLDNRAQSAGAAMVVYRGQSAPT